MNGKDRRLRDKSLAALEWPRLVKRLSERASSSKGRQACLNVHLATTPEGARRALAETSEMMELLREGGVVPLGNFEDVTETVRRCAKGASVKSERFHDIASMLEIARLVKGFFRNMKEAAPLLYERVRGMEELADLRNEINRSVDESGRVKENATPELRRKIQSMRDQRASLVNKLEEYMNREDVGACLQDFYYTQRGNRYVLPVKVDSRPRVEGIVHDSSQSGQTLFIEPRPFIDANNRLKMAELEVEQEINAILKRLAEMVLCASDKLYTNLEILTELDTIYAKARLALDLNAVIPAINDKGIINLKNVRHPHLALASKEVVPNDLYMGEDLNVLVISGPNTGGKTVTLKTIGLCALMVRAGIPIPAENPSSMSLFADVWADIGDEQSVEENISTFSGHILNIIGIMEAARKGSLVLLDELVTSTDPSEGSALAEAILHRLVENGSKVIATTHYTELKAYAEDHPGFANAGVGFDPVRLQPTYKLIQGIPGRSSAFETASRLGMDPETVERARSLINTSDLRLEELLADLEKRGKELEDETNRLKIEREQVERLKEEQEKVRDELKRMEKSFKREIRSRLAGEIDEARKRIKEILSEVTRRRTPQAAVAAKRQMGEIENRYRDTPYTEGKDVNPEQLNPGDRVVVAPLGVTGELLEKPSGKKKVRVMIGKKSMTVNVGNLKAPAAEQEHARASRKEGNELKHEPGRNVRINSSSEISSDLLDLRGYHTADAIEEMDKFLDRAVMADLNMVRIVHGHGTGALKKSLREHLDESPYVASWQPGNLDRGGGGDGITLVKLKQEAVT